MRKARARQVCPLTDTLPERVVQRVLRRLAVPFKKHAFIKGIRHQFDILIPDLQVAIEVNGCYWHGCPTHYPDAHKEQQARDKWFREKVPAKGWKLFEVWEHDIVEGRAASLMSALAA